MPAIKRIGIIGGSGVYDLEGIDYHDEVDLWTPFWIAFRSNPFRPVHGARVSLFTPSWTET